MRTHWAIFACLFTTIPAAIGCGGGSHAGTGAAGTGGNGSGGGATTGPSSTSSGTTSATTSTTSASTTGTSTTTASTSGTSSSGNPFEQVIEACVTTINMDRATLGLAPYARWSANEACAAQQAQIDGTNAGHSSFGMCGEMAQDECPGWPGPPDQMIGPCLAEMWSEGPGPASAGHGHYDHMSSTVFTKVACGFYVLPDGNVWATQDFQ